MSTSISPAPASADRTGVGPPPGVGPGPLLGLLGGVTRYCAVAAALRAGVFEALAAGAQPADRLAAQCGADPDRLAGVLRLLEDLGLVVRDGDEVAATPLASAHLAPGSVRGLDRLFLAAPGRLANLDALERTLAGEPPPLPVDGDDAFWADLHAATAATQRAVALAVAGAVGMVAARPAHIVEIGANAGAWGVALAGLVPEARVTVVTQAAVAPAVLRAAGTTGSADRLGCEDIAILLQRPDAAGPAATVGEPADVVVLANALRGTSAAEGRRLVELAAGRLAPDGRLLDADYFVDAPGAAGVTARLMDITMIANTRQGRVHSESDHREWLAAAGLVVVDRLEPLPGFPVLVAAPEVTP